MHKEMERHTARMEKRYLRERVAHLQKELADWPMTRARRAEKVAELADLRTELLGAR